MKPKDGGRGLLNQSGQGQIYRGSSGRVCGTVRRESSCPDECRLPIPGQEERVAKLVKQYSLHVGRLRAANKGNGPLPRCCACNRRAPARVIGYGKAAKWVSRNVFGHMGAHVKEVYCPKCFKLWGWPEANDVNQEG